MVFGLMNSDNSSNTSPAQKVAPGQNKAPPKRSDKIVERLDGVVKQCSPLDKSRSSDLVPLAAEFDKMKHDLRALVNVSKKYQKKMEDMQDAKFEFVDKLAGMSKRSPIYDDIGADVDGATRKDLEKLRQRHIQPPTTTDNVKELKEDTTGSLSMLGLYKFGDAQASANDNEYQSLVIDYASDWEKIVTERVEAELKHVKKLESDLRHYEHKVDKLRDRSNTLEEKGKEQSKSETEKLQRNEEKLKDAFNAFEREATKTCALIEAATHDGYKDLYPLIKNYMKWEMNRIGREHDMAEGMNTILSSLKDKGINSSKTSAPKAEPIAEDSSSEHTESTHDKQHSSDKKSE